MKKNRGESPPKKKKKTKNKTNENPKYKQHPVRGERKKKMKIQNTTKQAMPSCSLAKNKKKQPTKKI